MVGIRVLKKTLFGLAIFALIGCGSDEAAFNFTPNPPTAATGNRQALQQQHAQLLAEHHRQVTQALIRLSGRPSTGLTQAVVQSLQLIQQRLVVELSNPHHTSQVASSSPSQTGSARERLAQLELQHERLQKALEDAQATFDEQDRQFGTRIRELSETLSDPNLDPQSRADLTALLREIDEQEQSYRELAVHRINLLKQQLGEIELEIEDARGDL
jgi:hypothetical protein